MYGKIREGILMEAMLKYNLKDEIDREMYLDVSMATGMKAVLKEMNRYLKNKLKHDDLSEEAYKHIEEVQQCLNEALYDHKIILNY
jgi:hypothetical protein